MMGTVLDSVRLKPRSQGPVVLQNTKLKKATLDDEMGLTVSE